MYLCKEDQEKLTVKNAKKVNVAYKTLDNYCKEYEKNAECNIKIKKDLEPGIYAKNIKIVSSGNEPKLYGFVEDQNGEVLAVARIFDTSPAGYAAVATYCGAFMEAFNLYCYYNNI